MRGLVLAAAALLLIVPTTAVGQGNGGQDQIGDTDAITFYGHVFGHGLNGEVGLNGPMPSNTQAPIGENNYGLGTGVYCSDAGPTIPGNPATGDIESCQEEEGNKLALFSTAGPVQVDTRTEFNQGGGYALLHNERGQTKDIRLDTGQSVNAGVYFTMDTHGWFVGNAYGTSCLHPHPENLPCVYPYWGWDPGVYQNVVVEATLYHADLGSRTNSSQAPPIEQVLDNGEATEVAKGTWGPDTVMNGVPGAPNVNHFQIDLGQPQEDTIPRDRDFFLVYNVFQTAQGNGYVADGPMRWWSGEFFPPTYELPVQNAFTVERVVPTFDYGKLAILGIVNTPWGSYDVDGDTVDVAIEGPNGQPVNPDQLTQFADFSVAHGGHFKPVNVTWIWDYRASGVQPGNYSITVSAANLQGSAAAQCETWVTLEAGPRDRVAPGKVGQAACGTQSVSDEDLEDLKGGPGEGT